MSAQTNTQKRQENAREGQKAAKNAILFVSLKRCKRKRNEAKKRSKNEAKRKENYNILIIKHINRLNVHIKHTKTHIFNKIQRYMSEYKQNRRKKRKNEA